VYKLALFAVTALSWSLYVPLFAHFRLVVFMDVLFHVQLANAVSVGTFVIEFAIAFFCEVFAKLGFVVYAKIFDVLDHLFPG
jgi:hypothetical protein